MQYINRNIIKEQSLQISSLDSLYQALLADFYSAVSTQESLKIIKRKKKKLQDFYKNEDVRKHLVISYGLKCCYCESTISSASYFEVDHFYPKTQSGPLPIQFQSSRFYRYKIVNNIRNFHLSCKRCNLNKKDFVGLSISPNYYYNGTQWKESTDSFIKKNIRYKGAKVCDNAIYQPFIDKLHLNSKTIGEENGLHSSLLLERTRYLNETGLILNVCKSLCRKQDYKNAKTIFNFLRPRFRSKAHFSRMIVTNYGNAYLKIGRILRTH